MLFWDELLSVSYFSVVFFFYFNLSMEYQFKISKSSEEIGPFPSFYHVVVFKR